MDQALQGLRERYETERERLVAEHGSQLQTLSAGSGGESDAALGQRRLEMLNGQQVELSGLDRKFREECKQLEEGVRTDLEARHARAKLELREKQYQVRGRMYV